MNKKSAILFFSVLFLLSLGALYVYGTLASDIGSKITITSAFGVANSQGDGYGVTNWTKDGLNATINFTITMPSIDTADELANWPAGVDANITYIWFETPRNVRIDEDSGNLSVPITYTNLSVYQDSGVSANWECNATAPEEGGDGSEDLFLSNWTCINLSVSLAGPDTILRFAINFTANNTGDEEPIYWNISLDAMNETNLSELETTTLVAMTNIDAQEPRLVEINISDGNTTYANATWGTIYHLKTGLWTIRAVVEDTWLENSVFFAYGCNTSNFTWISNKWEGPLAESAIDITSTQIQGRGVYDNRAYVETTIDCTAKDNTIYSVNMSNETVTFAFLANDSFNHYRLLNDTSSGTLTGSWVMYYDDGDILPTIAKVNVSQTTQLLSDSTNSISKVLDSATSSGATALDGTSDYLKAGNVSFNIEVTGGYRPGTITILWNSFQNSTSAAATVVNSINIGGAGAVFDLTNLEEGLMLNATNNTEGPCDAGISACGDSFLTPDSGADYIPTVIYDASISLASNASENFVFWVLANNTNGTHITSAGPYRFIIDGTGPTMTMTAPDDRSITPRASITYSCKAADAMSGAYRIRWQLVKPGSYGTISTNFATLGADSSQSKTFSGDDTMYPGEYTIKCIGVDNVGNEVTHTSTSGESFTVHYSTTGAGEGAAAGAAADIDLSTSEEITITEKQGTISTFTLDGTTIHTIKIKTVDEIAGTVTIEIASDPITITLKIGEMKEVDVDADGANDISITLNGITDGVADITTKRLTPLPEKKPTEEVPPTEKPAEEIPTAPEAASKTWLWILIIVIIVVIGVGYWFMKKK